VPRQALEDAEHFVSVFHGEAQAVVRHEEYGPASLVA